MGDNGDNSSPASDGENNPDKRVSQTPSPERSKGSDKSASRRHNSGSSSSSNESSSSPSKESSSSDSDNDNSGHKSREKRKEAAKVKTTPPGYKTDDYVHLNTEETAVFPKQLKTTDTGSVHFADSHRSGYPFSGAPTPDKSPPSGFSQSVRERENRRGNCLNVAKRGNSGGLSSERGIYQSNISSPKERWGEQTSDQPQEIEFTYSVSALQDGWVVPPQTYHSEKEFHDHFCVPMSQQHQPLLRFIWGKRNTSSHASLLVWLLPHFYSQSF